MAYFANETIYSRFSVSHVRHLSKSKLQPKKSSRYHVCDCGARLINFDTSYGPFPILEILVHRIWRENKCDNYGWVLSWILAIINVTLFQQQESILPLEYC